MVGIGKQLYSDLAVHTWHRSVKFAEYFHPMSSLHSFRAERNQKIFDGVNFLDLNSQLIKHFIDGFLTYFHSHFKVLFGVFAHGFDNLFGVEFPEVCGPPSLLQLLECLQIGPDHISLLELGLELLDFRDFGRRHVKSLFIRSEFTDSSQSFVEGALKFGKL